MLQQYYMKIYVVCKMTIAFLSYSFHLFSLLLFTLFARVFCVVMYADTGMH